MRDGDGLDAATGVVVAGAEDGQVGALVAVLVGVGGEPEGARCGLTMGQQGQYTLFNGGGCSFRLSVSLPLPVSFGVSACLSVSPAISLSLFVSQCLTVPCLPVFLLSVSIFNVSYL